MTTTLTLGEVTFANNEIPENINFGGSQALGVHQLVGGQRIVDSMGRVDDDIVWSGLFFGPTSTFRARFLDGMRIAGVAIPLAWDQFNYSVVIKEFKCQFDRSYQIPYHISLAVVQDLNNPFPVLLPVTYNDAILAMLAEANDLALEANNPSLMSALALVDAAIQLVPDLNLANSAQIASIISPLIAAQGQASGAISALSGSIF